MTLQKLYKHLFFLVLTIVLLCSCNNGCEQTRETVLIADLKPTGRLSITRINVWAVDCGGGDSLIMNIKDPSNLHFILRPDSTVSQFYLNCQVNDNGDLFSYQDTLRFQYETNPYFLDMECGCSMFFHILEADVTNNLFRSITIKNNEITNEENINIILTY